MRYVSNRVQKILYYKCVLEILMNCMIHTCILYKHMALNWVLQKNLLGIKSNNCFSHNIVGLFGWAMSMRFSFCSLIPYKIWTTHLTFNFQISFLLSMDMKKMSMMRWFCKMIVILIWTMEMNLVRQYDEGKKLFWLIYYVLTLLHLIN